MLNKNYTLNNEKINNQKNYNLSKNYNFIKNWYFDKVVIRENTNIIRKLEIYNYIKRSEVQKIIKYLNTQKFKYFENSNLFPKMFNILLSKNNKHINGKGKVFENTQNLPKYYYYVDFVKVLNHRGRPLLIKIYRNKSQNKDFSKIEITYSYYKKTYNLFFLDWLNSLKSINEIIKKINKKFDFVGYNEDYSQKINFNLFLNKIINNKTKHNKTYQNKIIQMLS